MGCGGSAEEKASKSIERDLAKAKRERQREFRLLLLGTGESGKSTIVKQMKILHNSGYTKKEVEVYKSIVNRNLIEILTQLVKGVDKLEVPIEPDTAALIDKNWGSERRRYVEDEPMYDDFAAIFADPQVAGLLKRRSEFQLNDNAQYFLPMLSKISAASYMPSTQDILMCRVRTTGITETHFKMGDLSFTMVDVGGQRNERKKWIHQFEDVTAILFVVAMSEYDLTLFEDDSVNRMHESLKVWEEVCNNKWFKNTAMILFLNKEDLFRAKLASSPITVAFPDYTGGNTFDAAAGYITERFQELNHNPDRRVYRHYTTATDTRNIEMVFLAIKDILTHQSLAGMGMI